MTIDQAVELLELEPPATLRDIQVARRKLAKRWHPDGHGPPRPVCDTPTPRRSPAKRWPPAGAARAQRSGQGGQMQSVTTAAALHDLPVEGDGPLTNREVALAAAAARRARAEAGRR